ncbi:hypothetical protein NL529_30095, partial [Klebsiella pneumoniae]|nr:hypothetical protein [Klebsiella pneumoniae]
RRIQVTVSTCLAVVLFAGLTLWGTDTVRVGGGPDPALAAGNSPSTPTTTIGAVDDEPKCRSPLTPTDPLRLWIGGDSLAGSLGPSLG